MGLGIEPLGSGHDFQALRGQWEQLEAQLSLRTPFTSLLWSDLWWRHLRRNSRSIRDEFFAHVVTEQGRLVAIAPMMITGAPGRGIVRARVLQFFGADANLTEVRGLICRPQDQTRVIQALCRHLRSRRADWDWLEWSGIEADAATDGSFCELGGISWRDRLPCYFLQLPESWQRFRTTRDRNIKESLRKCYNSLRRDGHCYELRVTIDPLGAAAALGRFFALHRERARAPGFRPHPDHFADPRSRTFLHEFVTAMAERGQLYLFELKIDGTVVASRIAFAFADQLYLYYSGFLPQWGRYSVMTTLVAEAIKWAIEHRFAIVNLSTGEDISKTRWGPQQHVWHQAVQTGYGWRKYLTYRLCHGARMVLRRRRQEASSGEISELRSGSPRRPAVPSHIP
jgi:CelD/BcsL family acetyltransferase involved in cellulose biosynthesis